MEMYVDGGNLRRIARHLKVVPQTVAYWVTDLAEALPNAPMPEAVKEAELDELFTFIGDKKQNLHYHCGRPQDSLYFGLGGGVDPHPGSHPKSGGPSGITAMRLTPTDGFGITLAGTKSLQARPTPIRWKPIIPNCVTTWLV